MPGVIHVAVGVLIDGSNCVLLARRQKGTHLEGYWEFPGGKVESGETVGAALARELSEELGVEIGETSPLMTVNHDYGEKQVLLDVIMCALGRANPTERKASRLLGSQRPRLMTTKCLRRMRRSCFG